MVRIADRRRHGANLTVAVRFGRRDCRGDLLPVGVGQGHHHDPDAPPPPKEPPPPENPPKPPPPPPPPQPPPPQDDPPPQPPRPEFDKALRPHSITHGLITP